MSYKAVVFDLDGTVLDTAEGLAVAVNAARKECGYRDLPLETLISMAGNGARRLIARSIAYDRADGTSAEDIIDIVKIGYLIFRDQHYTKFAVFVYYCLYGTGFPRTTVAVQQNITVFFPVHEA